MGASIRWIAVSLILLSCSAMTWAQQAQYIDFWTISNYHYNPQEPFDPAPRKIEDTIPADVRELEGRKVQIYGNAMALDYSSGLMSEFILQASEDACGFGAMPRINEWIFVTMANGKKAKVSTGLDRRVEGTFHIREQVENGRVVSLYTIVADVVK